MKVGEKGFANLVLKEGKQMGPLQWAREFTKNVAENGGDKVIFDGWLDTDTGQTLARVSDNAKGLTPAEMKRYVATMLDSGQGYGNNFGWGSRVSTLAYNPAGVNYASRSANGDNLMRILVDNGVIGVYDWEIDVNENGTVKQAEIVDPFPGQLAMVDKLAGKNGTGTAILLEGDGKTDTWDSSISYRVAKFLAGRFYEWPSTSTGNPLDVKVAVFNNSRRYGHQLKVVKPYGEQMASIATAMGEFKFDTKNHSGSFVWAVIPTASEQSATINGRSRPAPGSGFIVDGEIFSLSKDHLSDFGIPFASVKRQVVILAKVDGAEMNPGRGNIVFTTKTGEETPSFAPWKELGEAFAQAMPDAIQALLDERRGDATSIDAAIASALDPNWKKRLKPVMVKVNAEDGPSGVGSSTGDAQVSKDPIPEGQDKGNSGKSGAKRPVRRSNSGNSASKEVLRTVLPSVRFVPRSEISEDDSSDEWAFGVAWNEAQGLLLVADDIVPVTRAISNFQIDTGDSVEIVQQAVQAAYGMELAATIIDAKGSEDWGLKPSMIEQALSPASLFAKLLGAQSIDTLIRNTLRAIKASA
jgi:hypothetical protein